MTECASCMPDWMCAKSNAASEDTGARACAAHCDLMHPYAAMDASMVAATGKECPRPFTALGLPLSVSVSTYS